MATTKVEFVDLGDELINSEFADFRRPLVITFPGPYDPTTREFGAGTTETHQAIPTKLSFTEYQRQDIQVTDFACVYIKSGTVPSVANKCTYSGKSCQIVDVQQDAADATIKLILRAS